MCVDVQCVFLGLCSCAFASGDVRSVQAKLKMVGTDGQPPLMVSVTCFQPREKAQNDTFVGGNPSGCFMRYKISDRCQNKTVADHPINVSDH